MGRPFYLPRFEFNFPFTTPSERRSSSWSSESRAPTERSAADAANGSLISSFDRKLSSPRIVRNVVKIIRP